MSQFEENLLEELIRALKIDVPNHLPKVKWSGYGHGLYNRHQEKSKIYIDFDLGLEFDL